MYFLQIRLYIVVFFVSIIFVNFLHFSALAYNTQSCVTDTQGVATLGDPRNKNITLETVQQQNLDSHKRCRARAPHLAVKPACPRKRSSKCARFGCTFGGLDEECKTKTGCKTQKSHLAIARWVKRIILSNLFLYILRQPYMHSLILNQSFYFCSSSELLLLLPFFYIRLSTQQNLCNIVLQDLRY